MPTGRIIVGGWDERVCPPEKGLNSLFNINVPVAIIAVSVIHYYKI